jgi:hypothetical protein
MCGLVCILDICQVEYVVVYECAPGELPVLGWCVWCGLSLHHNISHQLLQPATSVN